MDDDLRLNLIGLELLPMHIWNGLVWSGIVKTGSSMKRFFNSSNAFWQSVVHSNFWSFFKRSLRGLAISEK